MLGGPFLLGTFSFFDLDKGLVGQLRWAANLLTFTKQLGNVLEMACHNTRRTSLEAMPMRERWDHLDLPRLHPWSAARGARL